MLNPSAFNSHRRGGSGGSGGTVHVPLGVGSANQAQWCSESMGRRI